MDYRDKTILETAKNALMAISDKEVAMIAKNSKSSYAITILGFIIDQLTAGNTDQAEMTTKVFCVYAKQILEADRDYIPHFLTSFILHGVRDEKSD